MYINISLKNVLCLLIQLLNESDTSSNNFNVI